MKKTVSVLLAVLMLFSVLAVGFTAFAEDELPICPACGKTHVTEPNKCDCCVDCDFINLDKVADCAKSGSTIKNRSDFCCAACTGLTNCTCGKDPACNCPSCKGIGDPEEQPIPALSEETQAHLGEIFQRILRRIAEVFDRMFEVVFAIFNIA